MYFQVSTLPFYKILKSLVYMYKIFQKILNYYYSYFILNLKIVFNIKWTSSEQNHRILTTRVFSYQTYTCF